MKEENLLNIFSPDFESESGQPMAQCSISAGFPSPADDFVALKLDLNRELVSNPASTFYARVSGVSMVGDGIDDGDILVIDKSVEPSDGALAVCFVDGEFTLKRFVDKGDHGLLVASNDRYQPIKVGAENEFMVWGVVRYLIKKM